MPASPSPPAVCWAPRSHAVSPRSPSPPARPPPSATRTCSRRFPTIPASLKASPCATAASTPPAPRRSAPPARARRPSSSTAAPPARCSSATTPSARTSPSSTRTRRSPSTARTACTSSTRSSASTASTSTTGTQTSYTPPFPDLPACGQPVVKPCSPTPFDAPALPNDIAFAPNGDAFVTDSLQATIWRIPRGGGTPKVWRQDSRFASPGIGVNGLRLNRTGHADLRHRDDRSHRQGVRLLDVVLAVPAVVRPPEARAQLRARRVPRRDRVRPPRRPVRLDGLSRRARRHHPAPRTARSRRS